MNGEDYEMQKKRKNPIAKELRHNPRYRSKVVPNKKKQQQYKEQYYEQVTQERNGYHEDDI